MWGFVHLTENGIYRGCFYLFSLPTLSKANQKALSEVQEECEGVHRELEGLRKRVEDEGGGKLVGSLTAQVPTAVFYLYSRVEGRIEERRIYVVDTTSSFHEH